MTTPSEPCIRASIAQCIREKEAQVAALQQEIQQLLAEADRELYERKRGRPTDEPAR